MSASQSGRNGRAIHHVLVATDGSVGGDRALDFAVQLARETDSGLLIVNVSDDLSTGDVRTLAQIEGGMLEELNLLSNDVLDRAKARVQDSGVADIRTQVAWGEPVEGILEAARTCAADVIILGRRSLSPIAGLLLGSVSQRLAGSSRLPVLIVP
jgi:nucleotide-binding universal stress UspA family protein